MMTVLIAGHEARASALAWTWYLLVPIQPLRRSCRRVGFGVGRAHAASGDLADLRYTQAVFEEALWLYPPAWIITREALTDDEIGGCRVRPTCWSCQPLCDAPAGGPVA